MFSEKFLKILGKYLREVRKKSVTSQKELSIHLGYTTPQFVSNWERGLIQPPLVTIFKVLKYCGKDKKELCAMLIAEYASNLDTAFRAVA